MLSAIRVPVSLSAAGTPGDIGTQAFRAALREAGVADDVIRFELFDAGT